ncbi:YtpI family protein [Aneurinibacillus aneurinilyticus]|uniref:YtpI-like protein n=1 Tax=Aneurinibacillus aneurinilyticus ATCC 12856 TaxID=649747 RepID=U1YCR1_ANEAE|nr:YtpI family protein [Aneurinibacillus aneurinilyticus]ERI08596.1 hypothetical protein HMPREF0083_03324 [Aneurinibacillus aneurinilyticus ATCC 12856]MED0706122.1 YtpI family protein [Aneurinibacillus aneurinilyticus]MED0725096.1 YtpI family protein [Aneurinibacillus aneurinilyticus]MED0732696.1 YtpI family protein [Aneurinibacillus aneurinilyticus]MED0739833.1 YtpI family protein [Aneurinibacillus aneurinilyticus]
MSINKATAQPGSRFLFCMIVLFGNWCENREEIAAKGVPILTAILSIIIILSATFAIYYAITWRSQPGIMARIYQARMNISMGIALLGIGFNQVTFEGMDTIRLIIGIVLLFVGGVNLILGIRNLNYFMKLKKEQENKK